MSDIETVINATKQIEKMLELRLGANGRGLHDKVSSVQTRLPDAIIKKSRYIASVRNGVVHGDFPMIRDRPGFEAAVSEVTAYLRNLPLDGARTSAAPAANAATASPQTLRNGRPRSGRLLVMTVILAALLYAVALVAR